MPRREARLRLVPVASPARRVSEKERQEVRALLARARRDGRFGSSDLYEQRLEALSSAVTKEDLDVLAADLCELIGEPTRAQVLAVVRHAHADGTLLADGFYERTERCLGAVTVTEAEALVSDLGYRIERVERAPRLRTLASRVAPPVAAGACAGAAVLAAPLALGTGVAHWVPLAVGTAVLCTACAYGVALAWRLRPPLRRHAPVRGRRTGTDGSRC